MKAGLPTALRRRFGEEHNGPDDLVIVLDRINKVLPNVREFFLSCHPSAPYGNQEGTGAVACTGLYATQRYVLAL